MSDNDTMKQSGSLWAQWLATLQELSADAPDWSSTARCSGVSLPAQGSGLRSGSP